MGYLHKCWFEIVCYFCRRGNYDGTKHIPTSLSYMDQRGVHSIVSALLLSCSMEWKNFFPFLSSLWICGEAMTGRSAGLAHISGICIDFQFAQTVLVDE